ncbi:MAG: ferredoxin [Candidatus Kerfeldbacteria bacterium]|nr:ferredoxin [Candidatus Kerfeldbacteria bacterium]
MVMDESQGPTTNRIARVEIDREFCIGAASCVNVLPAAFALDKENKAILKPNHRASDEEFLNAAKVCPTLAIYLYDQSGKRLYPAPEI